MLLTNDAHGAIILHNKLSCQKVLVNPWKNVIDFLCVTVQIIDKTCRKAVSMICAFFISILTPFGKYWEVFFF